jgi:ATP-binding cassette subfamily B protein RaxB
MSIEQSIVRPESLLNFNSTNKLPCILQTEAAECGLACLAMISSYYGYEVDLTTLRSRYSISMQGATLKQVMQIGDQMALSSRALKLDLAQLNELQTPCILHWEMKHFVVLKKVTEKKITIHDPALGVRSYNIDEVDKLFTGIALELTPNHAFEKGKQKKRLNLHQFWSRIVGLKRSLTIIFALSVLMQIFALVQPYYIQTVVDDVILRADYNLLLVLAIGFGLLLLLDTGTSFLRKIVILSLSSKLNIQMAANVFNHLVRLPLAYFAKRHMGDIVSRFGSLSTIRDLLTTGLVTVFVDGIMASLTLAVMFYYDQKLTWIVIIIVFLYAFLRYLFYRPIRRLSEESIISAARENSHFMESVRAMQTIKLFAKESDRQAQWQNYLADSINKDIRLAKWHISFETSNKLLFGVENILVIYFAAMAVSQNLFTVGMLFAFLSFKTRFVQAMDSLIEKWIEFKMLELHFERIADIVFTPKDPQVSNMQTGLSEIPTALDQRLSGHLQVEGLSYGFSELDPPIFSGINMHITAGSTVAIVGPSGSGKTTLLKCMMGLLTPQQGNIMADGTAIAKIPDYRANIAAVMQDDQLLNGTIADNIACFSTKIDMSKVVYCANLACVHEDIMQTNMQYNTLVGDMGSHLSGGQKQRIILARALYKEPTILFMDEATSHLDVTNEMAINNHISQLSITRVIIAHRPQTIQIADRVLKLEKGQLQEITSSINPTPTTNSI